MKSILENKSILTCNGAKYLRYDIREIVSIACQLELAGKSITWENIGDPIAKGHKPPLWLVQELTNLISNPKCFAYGPSEGLLESRRFLCNQTNTLFQTALKPEHIVFFNGLGDAISTFYRSISPDTRILLPAPVYPAHYALEAFHANEPPLQYPLIADKNWTPDFDFIEDSLKNNPKIAGILLVNPDNPTGKVHCGKTLSRLASIARKFDVFLIVDEIYAGIQTDPSKRIHAAPYLNGAGAIIMHGISKLVPWPGGRCGWLEFHMGKHQGLDKIREIMIAHKRLEVGSSTLPQALIPVIFQPDQFQSLVIQWTTLLNKRIGAAMDHFKNIPGLKIHKPEGAFYLCLTFDKQIIENHGHLPMDANLYKVIKPHLKGAPMDRQFTLQLLASTGICTVPLSSFYSHVPGFRLTLLENDDEQFDRICKELSQTIQKFLGTKRKLTIPDQIKLEAV